jgi:plastocyanin
MLPDVRTRAKDDGHRLARRHRRRRAARLVASALTLVAVGSAGCASNTSGKSVPNATSGTLAPVQSGTVKISSRDNTFIPEDVTVTAGTKLVWNNDGRNDHNIVPVGDTPFHVDTAAFGPKATYEYVADKPGTYDYFCSIHGTSTKGMIGTVQVVPK